MCCIALLLAGAAFLPASAVADEQTKLTAAAGTAGAKFGISVSVSGSTAVVGAPDEGGRGAAYVFTRTAGRWVERATLVAPVPAEGAKFGFNVAVSGDTIVVGAPNVDQEVPQPGAAYVFVRSGQRWTQRATLTASDGRINDAFGFDVGIAGDTVVVGAVGSNVGVGAEAGSAYVFSRTGGVWSEQARLAALGGAAGDSFGYSVGVSGDTVVVGAPGDDVGVAVDQGSVRVFTRTGAAWSEQATLVAADGSALDQMGSSTAIDGDTVLAGAIFDDVGTNPKQGSAYVFVRGGGSWAQQARLTAPDGAAGDLFGRSVTATRDTVAVGAHFDDPEAAPPTDNRGSVYVFHRRAGAWNAPTKLMAADGAGGALLGVSVGMSGQTVIAGAGFAKVGANNAQGAAYVFRVPAGLR